MARGTKRDEGLRQRFLAACRESTTLTEVGRKLGFSRQRAHQLAVEFRREAAAANTKSSRAKAK